MKTKPLAIALAAAVLASACGHEDDDDPMMMDPPVAETPSTPPPPADVSFEISFRNLTANQPFSPVTVAVHNADYSLMSVGEAASEAVENIAESGSNARLLEEIAALDSVMGSAALDGILVPGGSDSLTVTVTEDQLEGLQLSLLTMLVNTNDGLAAEMGRAIGNLAVDESLQFTTISYDAGTEANTEAADTIPGPAGDGSNPGTDPARDDVLNAVRAHAGVVTADDGLVGSALTEAHRWDNPTLWVSVTRTE